MALCGPLPRAIALRISSVAVRQMPSSIGSVEFSMKKSAECSTKPRPVSTGPPLSTLTSSASHRQFDALGRRDDFELHQQIGKFDVAGRLVDDDAHGAFGRMRADVNHRARKALVAHRRHRDQHLAVEIAARRRLADADLRGSFMTKGYPISLSLQTKPAAKSSITPPSYSTRTIVAKYAALH